MMQTDPAHTILCNFHEDFKAETIAAEIAEQGKGLEQILVQMLGPLKRTFSNDVNIVETEVLEDHTEYTIVKAAREGIYDMLPETLFHHPTAHKTARSEKEIIKTIKRRREEEVNARKFFLPIEATINYQRIEMALYENRLDKRTHYDDLVQLFAGHWEIFEYLNAEQANIFLHLIPIIHDIRDDHPKIEEIMEMIFEERVTVSLRNQGPLHPQDTMLSHLAESVLGVDLTTGNIKFDEGVDEIVITIGPMESNVYRDFMPGRKNAIILELLCDYLLPVHADIITKFELIEQDRQARLADSFSDSNSILGQDMVLCG
ncbi:MAG TPA: hypothetical protein VFN95_05715 [Flavitalea sp.]|nr:hypothetical protein [Flavitalea sp.]